MDNLRGYQNQVLQEIDTLVNLGYSRILVTAPTGSGKTLIASNLIKEELHKNQNTIFFLCDRRKLVYQSYSAITKVIGFNPSFIMAGEANEENRVYVASIQTLKKRQHDFEKIWREPCTFIFDECHKCTEYQVELREILEKNPLSKIIGLTATPCNKGGYGLGNIYETILQASTTKELIEQEYLAPFQWYAPNIPDMKGVKQVSGDYDQEEAGKRMSPLIGDIVEHWCKYASTRKTLAFCSSITQSRNLVHMFTSSGVEARHIDCYMPEWEKEQAFKDLTDGKIKLLSNVQLASYGVDIPAVDCVLLARPTKSYVLYLQIIGRGLRTARGKHDLLVLDHSGSVYEHGFPDTSTQWDLSTHKKLAKKVEDERAESKEVRTKTCSSCHRVFDKGRKCPGCGHEVKLKEEQIAMTDGRLGRVDKSKLKAEIEKTRREDFYAEMLGYAQAKGFKKGWAYWAYKSKFKDEPPEGVNAKEPTEQTTAFLKWQWLKKNVFCKGYVPKYEGLEK